MTRKTDKAVGWGLRVSGPWPYLAFEFSHSKEHIEVICSNDYYQSGPRYRPMQVVLLPLREYNRLKRKAGEK